MSCLWNRRCHIFLLFGCLTFAGVGTSGPCGAESDLLILPANADTYFETYGSEDRNFGSEPQLRMDQWGGRQIFLRFSLTTLPTHVRILRAKLRLFVREIGWNEAGEFPDLKTCVGLFDVATEWTEDGLTFRTPDGTHPWRQGPGIPGGKYTDVGPLPEPDVGVHLRQPAIPLDPSAVTSNSWLELDVTEFIRARARAGTREINLLLRSSTLGRNWTFASRDADSHAVRPRLEVEYDAERSDFVLPGVFTTTWHDGLSLILTARDSASAPIPAGLFQWSAVRQPTRSRVDERSFHVSPDGVQFLPDVPGHYRIQAVEKTGSDVGDDAAWRETADVHVLAVPPHPRLYVTPETLRSIRARWVDGSRLSLAFVSWVTTGNEGLAEGRFHDMGIHEGSENNALAWLLTGDRAFLTHSIGYAQRMLERPMREHFGDVHEATFTGAAWVHAMAVHYDWCHDQLSQTHRLAVSAWLKEAAAWAWVRSEAPIAHNDGGARQCLLASAALALLNDDRDAPSLLHRSQMNFERNVLPWLNDGGRGGRSGDGGEYEGLHAFFLVRFAWMSLTATGVDVFLESPFFWNRLKHIQFGWYPRRLVAANGTFSLRQYYSPSGDHIRMGYVGDTQPYQSAAALCDRFRDTPEAQGVRWLAGDWPTQWMQYCLRWAVLGDWESVPQSKPRDLAWHDEGMNTAYFRSDWTDDATWILFENAPYVSAHGSLDSGTFEIFKGDLLAARTGNLDHGNVGAKHTMNYLHRTVAANCLLIHDPDEKWKGFLGGADGISDGGGQRTNFPLGSSPDVDTYVNYRSVFQRGQLTRFRNNDVLSYAWADLTPAYNSPHFHGGALNRPKVTSVTRQILYLRDLDTLLVFDRVSSSQADFQKTWLLHSLGELDVLDGQESKVDDGEFHYSQATSAVIRHGWPKPVPSFGRCLSVTLLPDNARMTKIGGRVELPDGQTEGWPGDPWHGDHRHRHLKDFWVNGVNYPPGNPPETRWFGDPASGWHVPGTPDESGGRGKWRLEVSPAAPAKHDVFFHALCPRPGTDGPFPQVRRVTTAGHEGALVADADRQSVVFFARSEGRATRLVASLPADRKGTVIVADLAPGHYTVRANGLHLVDATVAEDGILTVVDAAGELSVQRE